MLTVTTDLAVARQGALSGVVLSYRDTLLDIVRTKSKTPSFSIEDWAPLAAFVDTASFVRTGTFKEQMSWRDYAIYLTNWAAAAEWESDFYSAAEGPGVVYLQLEELSDFQGDRENFNTLSIFELNDDRKITSLNVYLQRERRYPY